MPEIKLKPCPFCGNEAITRIKPIRGAFSELDDIEVSVSCSECYVEKCRVLSECNDSGVFSFSDVGKTMENVIADWNRRVDDGKISYNARNG